MKLVIASDIHGAAHWCERLMDAIKAEQPNRVVLLGDLLYHGPRNDLPADYDADRTIFLSHGHVYGPGLHNSVDNLPKLAAGSAFVYGHTHVKVNQEGPDGIWLFNPGSVGIPKDGSHSYGIYENGHFEHRILGDA